jgi:signal recognition particle GTPase
VIVVVMTGANIFALNKMAAIKAEMDEVTANRLPRALAIADLNISTVDLRINQLQHAFATDSASKQLQEKAMIQLIDRINQNLDTYARLKTEAEARGFQSPAENERYAAFDQKWSSYYDLSIEFIRLSRGQHMQRHWTC